MEMLHFGDVNTSSLTRLSLFDHVCMKPFPKELLQITKAYLTILALLLISVVDYFLRVLPHI